jgi:hypothetical protein
MVVIFALLFHLNLEAYVQARINYEVNTRRLK